MAKLRYKVSCKKGKGGTKLAAYTLHVARTSKPKGKLLYSPKVNMTIDINYDGQGKPRKDN